MDRPERPDIEELVKLCGLDPLIARTSVKPLCNYAFALEVRLESYNHQIQSLMEARKRWRAMADALVLDNVSIKDRLALLEVVRKTGLAYIQRPTINTSRWFHDALAACEEK